MAIKKIVLYIVIISLISYSCCSYSQVLESGDFGTSEVTSASTSGISDCINYCLIGVCVWVICIGPYCSIDYTAKIAHNLPDLVVSAYPLPGKNSYSEAKSAYGSIAKSALSAQMGLLGTFFVGGGDDLNRRKDRRNPEQDTKRSSAIVFKEVSIIGSPVVKEISEQIRESTNGYSCASEVNALQPYYHSELNGINWRTGLVELSNLNSYNPTSHVIGTIGINYWGRIYPRQGFIHQRNDAKAAGVLVSRALHITTREDQAHIYSRPPLPPYDKTKKRWQLISPKIEDNCRIMGKQSRFGLTDDKSSDFKYGWLYWGRHKCCVQGTGVLVAEIETGDSCDT